MVQRALGIEQVRHHLRPRGGGRRHLAGERVRVADADQDARLGQAGDSVQGAGQFRGQGDDLQDSVAGVEQFADGAGRRIGHPVLVMGPRPER
jgi:hypothetical protein